ncbi:MAG: tRNA (guanine(46)-N(7))-methyltransferase TrmB, partial [Sphingomonadales bacterium]
MAGNYDFKDKFYGRRKGQTLSQRQRRLLRDILPSVSFQAESTPPGTLNPETLFDFQVKDVWLEIGFGKGEHLSLQAGQNSDIGFIGCEPFINGVAGLVTKIHESRCKNIRIYPDDARHVLSALKSASIGRLFLLHPDPWPKTRHAKRRFVSENNLDGLSRIMKPGAELRI